MESAINSILRRATRSEDEPYNILVACTHERYESLLARTNHNFFAIPLTKGWDTRFAPIPPNYHISKNIPVDIDLVICQNKIHYPTLSKAAATLRVPLITVEHTLPVEAWGQHQLNEFRKMVGTVNVFVSEYQQREWGMDGVVNHTGVDIDAFKPMGLEKLPEVLCVVNQWEKRDFDCGWSVWQTMIELDNSIEYRVYGDNPGLSEPAPNLVEAYNRASVFLNTTTHSTLPTVILESMACGLPVVSTSTCLIPQIIIDHGVNGFVSNEPKELVEYCRMLLTDKEMARKMGEAARQKIVDKFNVNRFVQNWRDIINGVINGHFVC